MNGTTKAFIIVFGFVGLLLAFAYMNRDNLTAREMNVDERAKSENREVWYKINDDNFSPPLLNFANGCWEYGDDIIYMNMDSGDFYFNSKTNSRQEIWVEDFDKVYATYNGIRGWGGEGKRNLKGDKFRVRMDAGDFRRYEKVNCPPGLK